MLKWSEHNPQVMTTFYQLWEQSHLTDVTLATEGKTFLAHKMLLSACSPYFRHLFINNPCKHPTVFLKDVPERHMELLLEYMYAGRIAVKHTELAEVLKTASSLKIRGLTTPVEPEGDREVPPLILESGAFLGINNKAIAKSGISNLLSLMSPTKKRLSPICISM